MKNNIKIKKIKLIESYDFDKFIENEYGKPYKFQQQDGCREKGLFYFNVPDKDKNFENDVIPEIINHDIIGVNFDAWLKRDPKQPLSEKENTENIGTNTKYYIEYIKTDDAINIWQYRNFYKENTENIGTNTKYYIEYIKTVDAINIWWYRNFYPDFQTLVNDLYKRGKIKKGTYVININW